MTRHDGDGRDRVRRFGEQELTAVLDEIDEANSADPNRLSFGGRTEPKELLHAEMVTDWVRRLDPSAGPAQVVAARAHHLRRWTRPRSEYPEGRVGYRRWRTAAARAQADEVTSILETHGAPVELVEDVCRIIRKEGLGVDPAVQTHEDALCLVFLQTQLEGLVASLGAEHATQVVARTIPKMSAVALEHAAAIELGDSARSVLIAAGDAANRDTSQ